MPPGLLAAMIYLWNQSQRPSPYGHGLSLFSILELAMTEHEQQSRSDDIDNTNDSTAEVSENSGSTSKGTGQRSESAARTPLVRSGHDGIALVIAGIVAAIITVAFIIPADSIFPAPASDVSGETASQSPAPEKPVTSEPKEEKKVDPASSDEDRKSTTAPEAPSPDSQGAVGVDRVDPARLASSSDGKLPLLASVTRHSSAARTASDAAGSARPSLWGRIIILLKLVVLVFLATICGIVVLGAMALNLDRPIGSVRSAICRMFACCWLATLALLIPFPVQWLLAEIHYLGAAVIFWLVSMVWFSLTPQRATVLLGGTMALLAAMSLGASVVAWATWT